MKFTFDKEAMLRVIGMAQEVIAGKSAQSVLSGVLLETAGGSVTIKATDSAVNFITHTSADVTEEGNAVVYCDKFMSILQSLPSGDIDFATSQVGDNLSATIRPASGRVKFSLKCLTNDKFPDLENASWENGFEIAAKEFLSMITQTSFAVSTDSNRYFMTGVYFVKENDTLVMVATDGRRLALSNKHIDVGQAMQTPVIVPTKVLGCILRNVPTEGNVTVALTEKMMFVKAYDLEYSTMLIDGKYPDYHKVIPDAHTSEFRVNKEDLDIALKRMMIMIDRRSSRLLFHVKQDGTLIISVPESEMGDASEELPCEYNGEEVTMALNCHFICDPLRVMNAKKVVIEFTDPLKAIVLRGEDGEGVEDYFHVIMPMNLK